MPSNKRPRRLNYSVSKKWPKSWTKSFKALKHYERLQKRIKIEGETKWLSNAIAISSLKLKKYWLKLNKN